MPIDAEALRARLQGLGFDVVRFAAAGVPPGVPAFAQWLAHGNHADMAWMERGALKRQNLERVLSGARSVIMLGVNYGRRPGEGSGPATPVWARYALHADYHDTMKAGLEAAGRVLEECAQLQPDDYRYYVDTGPVLERSWAARAGVGFIGKNAMLISPAYGNWLFLAAILTRADLPPDAPWPRQLPPDDPVTAAPSGDPRVGAGCGRCTRCLDACPTNAFPAPGVVDARRCISYQTIENKGIIPRELRAGIGPRIYGCDVCAEVCPWNRFAQTARSLLLQSRDELANVTLRELLELTPERFAGLFRGTAIKRLKLRGLLRNACVVAGNLRAFDCLDALLALAVHPEPIVRAHAVWAVRRLGAEKALSAAQAAESDPRVLDEYVGALEGAPTPQ